MHPSTSRKTKGDEPRYGMEEVILAVGGCHGSAGLLPAESDTERDFVVPLLEFRETLPQWRPRGAFV